MFQLPNGCRVFTKIEPSNQWGWSEVLANKANYFLETLVWQNSKDAQKKVPKHIPKPFIPEFLKKQANHSKINSGSQAHTTDGIRSILSQPRG